MAAVALKALPSSQIDKYGSTMPSLVNEDKKVESKVLQSYAAANSMKIPGIPGGAKDEKYDDDQDEDQKQEAGEDEFPQHN